jgi:predicted amidophosphoribosyltransferase
MKKPKDDDCCSKCGRPFKYRPSRFCWACKEWITRMHKWTIGADGRIRHRNCNDPVSYK